MKKKQSWQTSAAGTVAILAGLLFLACQVLGIEAPAIESTSAAIAAISTGVGLMRARDNDKSSEQVGAK